MSGMEGAALGAAVSLGLGAYKAATSPGFLARHEQALDAQVAKTHKLVDNFEKLRKSGDITDEDYDMFLQKKEVAIQLIKGYRDSISDYKNTTFRNPIDKLKKKNEVRMTKQHVKAANQDLQTYYLDSSSCSSDASSTTAASGSPPQAADIRAWADEVSEQDGVDDEEDEDFFVGDGHLPVEIGDSFSDGRYIVVGKLGWGHPTVWLAKDEGMNPSRDVTLKIIKADQRFAGIALSQIALLKRLGTPPTPPPIPTSSNPNMTQPPSQSHPGKKHLVSFLDHFRHQGPSDIHVCMVFEAFGENLLDLVGRCQNRRLPIPFVKRIAKQIILGLDYMHRSCGVTHTDLNPENIFISTGLEAFYHQYESSSTKVRVKIAGLENLTLVEHDVHHLQHRLQAPQYRCPEVILGAKWGCSSDFWSLACVLFQLITGDYLFDPSGLHTNKDADHIAQIIKLLGDIPENVVASGEYSPMIFNQQRFSHLSRFPLERLLEDNYFFLEDEANTLAAFLGAMLHLDPNKRANASDLTHHEWLEGIFEQSEIDVLRGTVQDKVAKERALDIPKIRRGTVSVVTANTTGLAWRPSTSLPM